jgi:PAS domain-containing protein
LRGAAFASQALFINNPMEMPEATKTRGRRNISQSAALVTAVQRSALGLMEADGLGTPLTEDGRYRLLVEAVTDYAIYMLDPNGIVASWNPGAQRFKGYRPDEIIGQHFSRF